MPRVAPLVFVSSTKQDLQDYREAIIRNFPAFDILYRGMEFFGARTEPPHKVMMQELAECDLYIGILAHRYGSVDGSGTSYTELEYRRALADGKPQLMFIIDESHKVEPRAMEGSEDGRVRLAELKRFVRSKSSIEEFTTPEDLVAKVRSALGKWLAANDDRWKAFRYTKLDEREAEYIKELYSADQETVIAAIKQLIKPGCRAAIEHFYSIAKNPATEERVAEVLFDRFVTFSDHERVGQVLSEFAASECKWRRLAILAIKGRAVLDTHVICNGEVDAVISSAKSRDSKVRDAVAHALGQLGVKRPDRRGECLRTLKELLRDKANHVVARATVAVRRIRAANGRV